MPKPKVLPSTCSDCGERRPRHTIVTCPSCAGSTCPDCRVSIHDVGLCAFCAAWHTGQHLLAEVDPLDGRAQERLSDLCAVIMHRTNEDREREKRIARDRMKFTRRRPETVDLLSGSWDAYKTRRGRERQRS